MSTAAATLASIKNRRGQGDTRPTLRRLGKIAGRLRRDLWMPSTKKMGLELECSYKTIVRDIDLLRDFFHYPLEYDSSKYLWRVSGPLPRAVL